MVRKKPGRGKILRRTFIVGALGGAAAGGILLARRLSRPALLHEITLGLTAHACLADAEHFDQLISAARKKRVPFHAIGFEFGSLREKRVEKIIMEHDQIRSDYSRKYEQLLKAGVPGRGKPFMQDEALFQAFAQKLRETEPAMQFGVARMMLAVKHGLPLLPIEWYNDAEIEATDNAFQEYVGKVGELTTRQATLEEQITPMERAMRRFAAGLKFHSARIKASAPAVLELLKKHEPTLAGEKQLRVLYTLGASHSSVAQAAAETETSKESRIKFFAAPGEINDVKPYKVMQKLASDPLAELSRPEVAQMVLGHNLQPVYEKLLDQSREKEVRQLRQKIEGATMADVKKLDALLRETKIPGLPPRQRHEEKAKFIYEYFAKKKFE